MAPGEAPGYSTFRFGYGLHLITNTQVDVPVTLRVKQNSTSETKMLPEMFAELLGAQPALADRCDDLSADHGLDGGQVKKALLRNSWKIRPLIDTRLMSRHEKREPGYDPFGPITRSLFPERVDLAAHDERGGSRAPARRRASTQRHCVEPTGFSPINPPLNVHRRLLTVFRP